ncbi:MAG TPA: bifunctional UDP-N-acetylglucosamine diphosphorylase/glucosamine-1-phosphate N-acetyltransferase GlmU [Burkholderiales bacterium]|jgi:bifunctional UDP-N-acetylglucosamine pyrophosphorylase/glucosamine-1-phosphate N-acetyltransferase|nr:bifunctional UDP-N-acetylglucosamine diphosphorylase/glucosamine-1-phosphate N-acetyltransferase GlmU [Burkholderiales bacterium]
MPLEIVILAAGQGKRMRSSLPKILHPLAGRPLLSHVLDTARALAPRRIIVVHGNGAEQVRTAFADAQVEWALQAEQLGTGHAVQQALPSISPDADVLILYADVPLVRSDTLKRLLDAGRDGLAVMTAELADPTGYGRIVRQASGNVARIVEQRDASASELALREVNAGFMAMSARRLAGWLGKLTNRNAQREYYLTDVVSLAVGEGVPVRAVKVGDAWEVAGVNSKRELAALERQYQAKEADRLLGEAVTLADPARIDVRGELTCGADVAIDVNCVFEGKVTLADGVRIGPNCLLRNVRIGAGTQILAFSHLEDSEIGARCRLGPYARLRPGNSLDDEVHVGNFVELKASRIGKGSKANHLSYIGDSEVGAAVNVGAGTITCNYDGAAKHRTIIEDECFIGSDTTLVAPVRVARGSYIGAGSTINKDTPAGQLTLSRARQVSLPGWKPPTKKKG